jgi:hypothetical protein
MCAACILLKLLNANITNPTMPRFSSKLQGEFSLKPVGFECFNSGKNILACQKIDNVLFMVYLKDNN